MNSGDAFMGFVLFGLICFAIHLAERDINELKERINKLERTESSKEGREK